LNGFQLPVVGSFEFPTNSLNEKYDVILDGEKFAKGASSKDPKIRFTESVETLQSIDEMGNWHLYFVIPEAFQGNVKISGFMENDGTAVVPDEIDLTTLIYHEIEGGEVIDITAKPKKASLVININSVDDGELLLKINDFLVRRFDNGEFIAQIHSEPGLFNGETEIVYITDEFGFEKGLTITIPFKKGTEKIEIFGSYVVPEFGQMAIMVLAGTIIGIVIISKKTNSFSNLFYTKM
jgi:predicted secreted protein with PEFG-CTERM motif